jgi:hypothetical protein
VHERRVKNVEPVESVAIAGEHRLDESDSIGASSAGSGAAVANGFISSMLAVAMTATKTGKRRGLLTTATAYLRGFVSRASLCYA